MQFKPDLQLGQNISSKQLLEIFKVGSEGGMRRSLKTESLVLMTYHNSVYKDEWIGNVLHYTGMGREGNQSLDYSQNRTLRDSDVNGVTVFLFEVPEKDSYIYRGRVALAAEPYPKSQTDFKGNDRSVWIFPLKTIDQQGPKILTDKVFEEEQIQKEKKAYDLPYDELKRRALTAKSEKNSVSVLSNRYSRNEYIAALAKRRANGKCQLCQKDAPFKDKAGEAFLESHHINLLSAGGNDSIENTVALCPNCHRKMHICAEEKDRQFLFTIARNMP